VWTLIVLGIVLLGVPVYAFTVGRNVSGS